jgi:endonuclease YncB( thermonuclease family)
MKKTHIILTFVTFCLVFAITKQYLKHYFKSDEVIVVDGDSLKIGPDSIRLQGIDAPEIKQTCQNKATRQIWVCGIVAKEKLAEMIHNKKVVCKNSGTDKYKRRLAYCFVDGVNINQKMVRDGWAIAYSFYDKSFVSDEEEAKKEGLGIWSSIFEKPAIYRKKNK